MREAGQLKPLMEKNFLEYASYVIMDRAIPELRDGCKPVQRRILHTLLEMHDGKFHKVANVIGECMKLHPHGDASIGDALVVLANKEYFIERQGNFGNILTGHEAAAPRYTECRLTPLARRDAVQHGPDRVRAQLRRQAPGARGAARQGARPPDAGRRGHRRRHGHHHPAPQLRRAPAGAGRHPEGRQASSCTPISRRAA